MLRHFQFSILIFNIVPKKFCQDIKHLFSCLQYCSFKEASYSGGGNITFKGSLEEKSYFEKSIFRGEFPMDKSPIHLIYSVSSLLVTKIADKAARIFVSIDSSFYSL